MRTCPQCQASVSADRIACTECGTTLEGGRTEPGPQFTDADYDPEKEREQFENRYGIELGDRTIEEYLRYLSQQDYSLSLWTVVIAVAQLLGIGLFAAAFTAGVDLGVNLSYSLTAISIIMAVGIVGDTSVVGQFRRWAKIRWTYILLTAIPLVGHISAFLYLLLRRLKHEQTVEYRRRLLDAGFDLKAQAHDG